MGFKKENYTLKGICICVYFLLISNIHTTIGQSHCPVRVDFEPSEVTQVRSANKIEEVKFPFFQQWSDLDNIRLSDDEKASVSLPNNKRSTLFKGKNLGFSLPNGAQISGIELIVEGHSEGDGFAEGQMVRLLNSEGEAVGVNAAHDALPIGSDWKISADSTDFKWRYGSPTDTWGIKAFEELVNDKDFGYALQIRNKLNAPINVEIDHIQMIVYYTPLYEICSTHACVPFYIDESEDPLVTYEWYLPQGFELISDSEEDPVINIGVSYADYGEYEICVESFYKETSQGICCRRFNYSNCEPSQISGQVFFDKNNDSSNNSGDTGLEDILINLYSDQGIFVSTSITTEDGNYTFSNLLPGLYYVEVVDNIDSLVFSTPNIGPDTQDSDITGTFGEGTTELINIASGDTINSIDAGFNLALTIGNFVWEDINGDGRQQDGEPGIADVNVTITSASSVIQSTKTDTNGYYIFSGLPSGDYEIKFADVEGYIPTIPNNAGDEVDSDLIPNESIALSFSEGGIVDSVDAGYYRLSSIGDFVWEDINKDGLQDETEPGIEAAILNLIDENDTIIQTILSDINGEYKFENIPPGMYHIQIQLEARFFPTEFEIGGLSSEIDSDVFADGDKFISNPIEVASNTTNISIDFGFVEKPALVGGFTFLDGNNNGQYDGDELFVPEVNVFLFNSNNEQVDSTQSDIGGFYLFENVSPDSYYLVFELKDDYLFTASNIGDDLSDSDVTNDIPIGRTDLFQLMPDEENYTISAGYQRKPKVGDFIWLDENGNGLQDAGETGLNDIVIELFNDQNELIQSTTSISNPETDEAGFYQFESLELGNYYIKVPTIELYDFAIIDDTAPGQNSTITNENGIGTSNTFGLAGNECNEDLDAGYAFKKGNIVGEVWIDMNEDGIQGPEDQLKSGIRIELFNELDELVFFRNSNPEGEYFFTGLDAGNYYLVFTPTDQYRFTSPLVGTDITLDSDITEENAPGSTALLTVMDGVTIENIDAGLIDGSVDINGTTWTDENGDGIQQVNEAPIPDIRIELYNLNDSLLATTISDITGRYKFENNLAGDYYIVFDPENASLNNTLSDQGTDENSDDDVTSFYTVGSTSTISLTFFQENELISAGYYRYSTIGDQVFIDINDNAVNDNEAGLDNVIVKLLDSSGATITSDTTSQGGGQDSGYYLLDKVPPGFYTVEFTRPLFYQFVVADQGGDDNTDSDVAEVTNNIGVTKEIEVRSGTENLSIDAGLFFQVPTESSISGLVWDDSNTNGLRDMDEALIPSISMTLENQIGEIIDMAISDVDGVYTFENLPEGFYRVRASDLLDKITTFPNVGLDDSIDSDFFETDQGFLTESFFLASFEDIEGVDLGLVNTLNVGDFVWEDLNNNGVQDENEIGIEEIEITITSENGVISETVFSNAEGAYQFTGLPAGNYKICVDLPSGFNFAKSNVGTDLLDSDVDSSGCTMLLDLKVGGTFNDLDIGLTKNGSVQGIAFVDLSGNGVINFNDSGLDGVIVSIYDDTGELLNSTETITVDDIPGIFEFNNLKATDYYLVFEFPEDYIITEPNIGDDLTDSDITGTFGEGSTDLFAIPSGGIVNTISGGAYLPASIGDEVWLDENEDGIRDDGESGVEDIEVIIFRSFGVPFDTTYTDEEGLYQFENLKQGLYFIQFVIPQEFTISPSDQGIDDSIDSDSDNTGKTPLISLAHGADLESVDCGIYASMASLRSVVWNDSNADGMRQNQEARIPGIRITLFDQLDNVIETTQTNSLGLYAFQEIPEGDYKIFVDLTETDYAVTSMNMNDDDFHDSDIMVTGESEIFTSHITESILSVPNIDAGLYESGELKTIVWEDENADGIYDMNEMPFKNVEASLYSSEGTLIGKESLVEGDESLHFKNLQPGKYYLKYKVDEHYVPSPKNGEVYNDNNSDIYNFEGYYYTPIFQVLSNEIVSHIDAGFYKGAEITSDIWYDDNVNGIQDDQGESPSGIYATLFDSNQKSYGTIGIDQEGQISFKGIPKGEYYIKYYSLSSLKFTKSIQQSEMNSDVDHSNGIGTTALFEFDPYTVYTHIDAGLIHVKETLQELTEFVTTQEENEVRNVELDMKDITFEVYPNPAANYLKIKVDKTEKNGIISMHNNQNRLVFRGSASDIDRIDLSDYHPGIYYIKYDINGKSITKKVLKIQ